MQFSGADTLERMGELSDTYMHNDLASIFGQEMMERGNAKRYVPYQPEIAFHASWTAYAVETQNQTSMGGTVFTMKSRLTAR
jgi:hypothetical protein